VFLCLWRSPSSSATAIQCCRFGDVAKVNFAMAIRHGVIIAPIGGLADELECFARSDMFVGIMAPVD